MFFDTDIIRFTHGGLPNVVDLYKHLRPNHSHAMLYTVGVSSF